MWALQYWYYWPNFLCILSITSSLGSKSVTEMVNIGSSPVFHRVSPEDFWKKCEKKWIHWYIQVEWCLDTDLSADDSIARHERTFLFLSLSLRSTRLISFTNAMRTWTACVTRLEMQPKLRPKVQHGERHCIIFLLSCTLQSLTSFWIDMKHILSKHAISFLLGCNEKAVDVVFLIDGSRSLTNDNFQQNKDFVMDIMSTLANKSIKVWLLLH